MKVLKITLAILVVTIFITSIYSQKSPQELRKTTLNISHTINASHSWEYVPSDFMEKIYNTVKEYKSLRTLKATLYMNGLIDKYGKKKKPKEIKIFEFKEQDIRELRKYESASAFFRKDNEYVIKVKNLLSLHPFVDKFWIQAENN